MPDGIIDEPVPLQDKNGDSFTLAPVQGSKYDEALAVMSPDICVLDILNDRGVKVGVVNYYLDPEQLKTVYLNWVALSLTVQDRGYLLAMLAFANTYFQQAGMRKLVLVAEQTAQATFESFGFVLDPTQESQFGRIQMERTFE
jgi:hypothetical protein